MEPFETVPKLGDVYELTTRTIGHPSRATAAAVQGHSAAIHTVKAAQPPPVPSNYAA